MWTLGREPPGHHLPWDESLCFSPPLSVTAATRGKRNTSASHSDRIPRGIVVYFLVLGGIVAAPALVPEGQGRIGRVIAPGGWRWPRQSTLPLFVLAPRTERFAVTPGSWFAHAIGEGAFG